MTCRFVHIRASYIDFNDPHKIRIIKEIRHHTDLKLKESKDLMEFIFEKSNGSEAVVALENRDLCFQLSHALTQLYNQDLIQLEYTRLDEASVFSIPDIGQLREIHIEDRRHIAKLELDLESYRSRISDLEQQLDSVSDEDPSHSEQDYKELRQEAYDLEFLAEERQRDLDQNHKLIEIATQALEGCL